MVCGSATENGGETMADGKVIRFPTYNISIRDAWEIVKYRLDDEGIALQSKVLAIEMIAEMETHNSITKDDLVKSLRWLFDHYEF